MDISPAERLKGLVPFVYAAEEGSFAAAAQRLHLTPSAVSKSVARLEARLGVVLFERSTRTLLLTEAGQAFHDTCTRILAEIADAHAALAARQREPTGVLRLALPATFGRLCVMPVLLEFFKRYADLRPQLMFADRFVDLHEEGVDLAIRIGGGDDLPESMARLSLGRERLIFCAAPAYLRRRGTPTRMDQLAQHDCIGYGYPDGRPLTWTYASEDGGAGRSSIRPRIQLSDAEAQLASMREGLGIGQIATWLARDDLASGALVPVLDAFSIPGLPLQLLWPRTQQLTPKVSLLIEWLQHRLAIGGDTC